MIKRSFIPQAGDIEQNRITADREGTDIQLVNFLSIFLWLLAKTCVYVCNTYTWICMFGKDKHCYLLPGAQVFIWSKQT